MKITVQVKAGADKNEVTKIENSLYEVSVRERQKKGKANAAVVKLLSKHFGKPVRIVSGQTSKTKIIEIG